MHLLCYLAQKFKYCNLIEMILSILCKVFVYLLPGFTFFLVIVLFFPCYLSSLVRFCSYCCSCFFGELKFCYFDVPNLFCKHLNLLGFGFGFCFHLVCWFDFVIFFSFLKNKQTTNKQKILI